MAAASVLLLIAATFFLWPAKQQEIYATAPGEILEFDLSDGTKVYLNGNSSLTLPEEGWGAKERTVSLEGEAFFSVTRKVDDRAFIVSTKDTDVRVLGTRFNVRERRGSTRIFLEEGAVRVGWKDTPRPDTDLLPGEMVVLPAAGKQPVHTPAVSSDRHTSWKRGHLVFDQYPLAKALEEISDIYGVKLRLETPALADKKITTTGVPVDNLEVALLLLETALNLQIEAESEMVYRVLVAE